MPYTFGGVVILLDRPGPTLQTVKKLFVQISVNGWSVNEWSTHCIPTVEQRHPDTWKHQSHSDHLKESQKGGLSLGTHVTSHIFLKLLLSIGFSFPLVIKLLPLNPGNRSCREQGGRVCVSAQDLVCYVGSSQQSRSQTDEAVIIISQYVQIPNQYILYLKLIQCYIT